MSFPALVKVIDTFDHPKRFRKLSNEKALEIIIHVLKSGIPWRQLDISSCSYHTVLKRFKIWMKNGVFEKLWKHFIEKYTLKRLESDPLAFKNIYIDSTMIKNIGGVNCTGKNPSDRGRLATKMSAICDVNMVPLSATFYPANLNDTNTIETSIEKLPGRLKVNNRYSNTLIGDMGYISQAIAKEVWKESKIKILTGNRRNATKTKKYLSPKKRQLLKSRHRVENLFCRLDKFKRLYVRVEKDILSYEAFNFLAMTLITLKWTEGTTSEILTDI